jgi:phosphohistidine phosphatase SixA
VLLVVGHQPTSSQVAELLIGGGSLRLPTGALARVDLDVDQWDVGRTRMRSADLAGSAPALPQEEL